MAHKNWQHLEGKSILNLRDADSVYVIKEAISLCKTKGEGFMWSKFARMNDTSKKQFKQLAFVKNLEHYNMHIGSAEYLDVANAKTKKEILSAIGEISSDLNNYIFILNTKGDMVFNVSQPENVGKNVYNLKNQIPKILFEKAKKALLQKGDSFISYDWKNQKTKKYEKKYSYIRKVPNSDWIIGSGVYDSDIKNIFAEQTLEMYKKHQKHQNMGLLVGLLILLISFIISLYISNRLKKYFLEYQEKINRKNKQLNDLNESLEKKVEKRTLELEKSKQNLEVLATTDALTKIHNRYSIMKILHNEVVRAQRHKLPLCVMLYDIDFFKQVNDSFGHQVGDEVLQVMTQVVKTNIRDIDFIGRYGGEEFLVIFPNTSLEIAKKVSNRIREDVAKTDFDIAKKVTISQGLVELNESEMCDQIFKRLDVLLYKSKEGGRNRLSS